MPSIFLWLVVNSTLLLSTSGFFHGIWKLVNKNNCNKKRTAFLSCSTFKLSLDSKRSDVTTIKPHFAGIMYNSNNKSSIVFLVFHIRYAGSSVTAFPFSLTRVGLSTQAACSSDSYSFLKLTHFICCLNKKLHVSHDIFLHCFIHKVWQKKYMLWNQLLMLDGNRSKPAWAAVLWKLKAALRASVHFHLLDVLPGLGHPLITPKTIMLGGPEGLQNQPLTVVSSRCVRAEEDK